MRLLTRLPQVLLPKTHLQKKGASLAKTIADYYTANPTVPVTKQNANAAATVINAHADMAIANGSF